MIFKITFWNLPHNETPLPLRSTTRRIRDRSVMHVTYPTGDNRSVLSGKTPMNKIHVTCRRSYPPVTLRNTITTWTPMGIRTDAGYEKPRTVNRHKIRHYFWIAKISRALLGLYCRSQWLRSLRRGPSAARLLGLWVRIPPGSWTSVCCECCVLSGRSFCVGLITLAEESYKVWCVQWVWSRSHVRGGHDRELGRSTTGKKNGLPRLTSTTTLWTARGKGVELVDISGTKSGGICKVKLMILRQTIRIKMSQVFV